jgi:cation:H+ antiporter
LAAGWIVWLEFLFCLALIGVAGFQLSKHADVLAEKTGLGRTWVGLVVLAFITSLPEGATGISAVLWVNAPDITVGDLLGSCVFNLLILAMVDLFHPPGPVLTAADRGHILAASLGIVMLGVVLMGMLSPDGLTLAHAGLSAPVLLITYLVAMRVLFRYQLRDRKAYLLEHKEELLYEAVSLSSTLVKFGLNALVVVAAGFFMPRVAGDMAHLMGWHQSMVATIFVAATTSLPEMVVTFSALRLGAVDLAVGNLFGSNLVNLALLGLMDLLYVKGPILKMVSPQNAGTAVMAIVMTGIASAELMYRPHKKILRWMSLGAFLLTFLYVTHIFLQMLAG